jgi:hypothetical protein
LLRPTRTKLYLVRRTLKRNAQVLVVGTARVDILLARQKAKEKDDLEDIGGLHNNDKLSVEQNHEAAHHNYARHEEEGGMGELETKGTVSNVS